MSQDWKTRENPIFYRVKSIYLARERERRDTQKDSKNIFRVNKWVSIYQKATIRPKGFSWATKKVYTEKLSGWPSFFRVLGTGG